MKSESNFSLKTFNSFGVDAHAAQMLILESMDDIVDLRSCQYQADIDLVLGGGSNMLFVSDVPGTVYLNRIKGRRLIEEDGDSVLIEAAAGENWHQLVLWTLDQGYCGLENLSLIPGLVGAAPMQNIGAYGVEISSVLDSVTVFDWQQCEVVNIDVADCGFAYRDSRFKSTEAGRFLILSARLRLQKQFWPKISYAGLADELSAMKSKQPGAREVSDAVIRIRQRKLPDPAVIGNAGSFFKNPEISIDHADRLRTSENTLPVFPLNDSTSKLSAAWLIEQCGWKGFREGDAGVSPDHSLVLVNYGQASGMEIYKLSKRISESVSNRFGITLEREPQLFGATD